MSKTSNFTLAIAGPLLSMQARGRATFLERDGFAGRSFSAQVTSPTNAIVTVDRKGEPRG